MIQIHWVIITQRQNEQGPRVAQWVIDDTVKRESSG